MKMASQDSSSKDKTGLNTSFVIFVWCMLIVVRSSLGYEPHSGQDNYHGNVEAYGGDYEAQRHWMELTWHLPIGDWYWHDLEYWGLDYPPLTAYVSYVCGALSSVLVGPESVALYTSRGLEDQTHKRYMRGTVLVLDMLVYGSAIWVISRRGKKAHDMQSIWTFAIAMSQPALLLIDHAHFQYNSVSLGFALWAFHYMTVAKADGRDSFFNCIIGAFWFCLALNFKQMTLYYAPAVFFYLLGRCCGGKSVRQFVMRFVALGVTVIATCVLLWWPFVWYAPSHLEATATERLLHVLHRIFPFQRGLFEGKVSNLWCTLSTKPFSVRERVPESIQPTLALVTTLILVFPSCVKLFQLGRSRSLDPKGARQTESDWRALLWGTTSTALAFFLASFQVHEKSILMAVAPVSLLLWDDFQFVNWFSLTSTWTLWPLMRVDRIEVGYVCITIMYFFLALLFWEYMETEDQSALARQDPFFQRVTIARLVVPLCYLIMLSLHVLEIAVDVPPELPDLFPVLWSISGCGMFCLAWIVTCWRLYIVGRETETKTHHKLD